MIIGILGAIAVPVLQGIEIYRLQSSASMVASKLTETRMNALKRNRNCWLQIVAAENRVQVQTAAGGGGNLDMGLTERLAAGVTFVAPPALILFDSTGRPANPPPQTLTLQNRNGVRSIVSISTTGRIRVD